MPLQAHWSDLDGVADITCTTFEDARGFFRELGRASEFDALGIPPLVQDNESRSRRGVLRGIHYQASPSPQGKLVRAVSGRVLDVAVDLRRSSPTFLDWHASELDAEKSNMLWIPEGFGHAFLALTDPAVVHYRVTAEFHPDLDRAIAFDDPDIGIDWPDVGGLELSPKDRAAPRVADADLFE